MFASAATYQCRDQSQCRALCSVAAEKERQLFLVGTAFTSEANELHVLEYDPAENVLFASNLFVHVHEVVHCASSPARADTLATAYAAGLDRGAALWRLPDVDGMLHQDTPLEALADFAEARGRRAILGLAWEPLGPDHRGEGTISSDAVLMVQGDVQHYHVGDGAVELQGRCSLDAGPIEPINGAVEWNPHDHSCVGAVFENGLHLVDLRTHTVSARATAHAFECTALAFNPLNDHMVATGGTDRLLKFWDTRNLSEPLLAVTAHSHWVSSIQYNRTYDQLILTGGTDCLVNLWRISSLSTTPTLDLADDITGEAQSPDVLVKRYEEHEESVQSVAWSASDEWVFASVSHDGKVIASYVPSAEKYSILL